MTRNDSGRVLMDRIRDLSDLSTLLNQQLENDCKQWVEAAAMSHLLLLGRLAWCCWCSSACRPPPPMRGIPPSGPAVVGEPQQAEPAYGATTGWKTWADHVEYLCAGLRAAGAGCVADCNGALTLFWGLRPARERLEQRLLPGEAQWARPRVRQMLHVRRARRAPDGVIQHGAIRPPAELLLAPAIPKTAVLP